MKPPGIPDNEQERLRVLRSLGILDSASEERFDRLTRLARRLFDVPIALVSLVDENRQWFKSCVGLDVSETPREVSFCGHAILDEDILVVADAKEDPRFADNLLVTGPPHIRFYAGCPLKHLDGSMLGTLCIIDQRPRRLGDEDLQTLRDLANLAERELVAVQLATLDDLTQISNRRGFTALARNSMSMCARLELPVTLVFFDLDGLKRINDHFGHAEGDTVLVEFAGLIRETFRESDVMGRLGGDEFVVLLSDTSMDSAADIIARFRESIDRHNAEHPRGYRISFSDGVVTASGDIGASIETLLSEADALMYEKKLKRSAAGRG